ncbi:MAG: hypothetical protein R3B52_00140 [Candidatus Paceibacterota bacterium]
MYTGIELEATVVLAWKPSTVSEFIAYPAETMRWRGESVSKVMLSEDTSTWR